MENKFSLLDKLLAECENCRYRFKISSVNVSHKERFTVNGKSIFLTYYDCQSCGRRHFVQIDDANSIEKMRAITNEFYKLIKMRKQGKEISEKQLAKFKKARQHLSDYRMNLMKEYTGKLIRNNETESDFVLRFSV